MGDLRARFYTYLAFLLLAAIFLLVPRGTTVVNTNISLAPDGKPVLTSVADKKEAFYSSDSQLAKLLKQQGIYGQSFQKQDYGFVVYHRFFYRFDLSNVPSYVPAQLVFSADVPGQITSIKGGNYQGNKAYWTLKSGQNGDFSVESKSVRWWLIILTNLLVLVGVYAFLVKRKLSKEEAEGWRLPAGRQAKGRAPGRAQA